MTRAIIIDTETTGLDDPIPVEVAWAGLNDDSESVQRYQPGKAISYGAMATHHITDADVASAPPFSSFRLPPQVSHLIGHNIDFDWKALGEPPIKRICTLALARDHWPDLDAHSLGALIYKIRGAEARALLRDAHSALQDVRLCRIVLEAITGQPSATLDPERLWQRSERARLPRLMPFGKHRGQPIREIPADYRRWLLNQADLDPYLRQALTA